MTTAILPETCPICRAGELEVVEIVPDPKFGEMGALQQTLRCNNTARYHEQKREYKPHAL